MSNQITLNEAISLIVAAPQAAYFVKSSPGMGKTQGISEGLRRAGYEPTVISAQNIPAEDLAQIPRITKTGVEFLSNNAWAPKSKRAFILDELSKAPLDVQNAFLPLIHGRPRTIMGHTVPDDNIVVVLGNSSQFRAGDSFAVHILNRVVQLELSDPTPQEATKIMLDCNFDSRIIKWVEVAPAALCSYDLAMQKKPHSELTHYFGFHEAMPQQAYCSMRSLETASTVLKGLARTGTIKAGKIMEAALAGCIGPRAAAALNLYLRDFGEYVDPSSIVANPMKAVIPKNLFDQRLAILGAVSVLDEHNWEACLTYAERFPQEFKRVFITQSITKEAVKKLHLKDRWNKAVFEVLS